MSLSTAATNNSNKTGAVSSTTDSLFNSLSQVTGNVEQGIAVNWNELFTNTNSQFGMVVTIIVTVLIVGILMVGVSNYWERAGQKEQTLYESLQSRVRSFFN